MSTKRTCGGIAGQHTHKMTAALSFLSPSRKCPRNAETPCAAGVSVKLSPGRQRRRGARWDQRRGPMAREWAVLVCSDLASVRGRTYFPPNPTERTALMRIGSRSNPLTDALLAGHASGAYSLPDSMVEARDRLASLQGAVSALRPPGAESAARAEAIRVLVADPASDVAGAVAEAHQADSAHELRASLLREAVEAAHDELDRVDPEAILTQCLQPAFTGCVGRLVAAYRTFAPISTDPDQLWNASPRVRGGWTTFRRAANNYEAIRTAWRQVRAGSPAQLDRDALFEEVANLGDVWPERVEGLRPISTMTPPWPPRRDTLGWLLWAHQAGAVLHLPSAAQQDAAWSVVFGARAAEFGRGDKLVNQYRDLGHDIMAH